MFALIDDLFIFYLTSFLNPNLPGGINSLFEGGSAMLGTSSSRFIFARALDWIDKTTFDNLNILRKIRNKFAHEIDVNDFSDAPISGLITSLVTPDRVVAKAALETTPELVSTDTPRSMFLGRSALVISQTMRALLLNRISLIHHVSPQDLFPEVNDLPEGLKTVHMVSIRFFLGVCFVPHPKIVDIHADY